MWLLKTYLVSSYSSGVQCLGQRKLESFGHCPIHRLHLKNHAASNSPSQERYEQLRTKSIQGPNVVKPRGKGTMSCEGQVGEMGILRTKKRKHYEEREIQEL